MALVYDEAGAVAATLPTERSAMDPADADYERLLRQGLPYQGAIALPPGRYQVRLAAREDATGLLGSAWQRVEFPDLAAGRLTLSSLFLLEEKAGRAAAPAGPDAAPGPAQRRRRSAASVAGRACTCSCTPTTRSETRRERSTWSRRRRSSGAAPASGPRHRSPWRPASPGIPVVHTSRIKLQRFDPGDYELRVTVTDRGAGALATRSVPFTVE